MLLRDTAPGETPGPVVRPDATDADPSIRYRIDGEIARGGMGAVLKGRDPDLGRDVAIKVLRADLRDKADLVRRFVEEAQIGGQLQHPGVVPIYELGTFADRRPFFSMKLVKGQTLADLLAARSGPADDLPRFLSIFAAIAQTMAYSHTRGVIHRDLKPSNVMVGSFGEVQVMDWGLARVLPRGGVAADARAGKEPPEETLITTAGSGSDRDLSRAGSIMGTPSYMPPEQARGQTDRIDERADVFALGSILCEVLTAKPAFTGRAATEILRKAADGATADALARLDGCGAEAELIGLAKDCLAVEPEGRPRDANVVAERITAYLAGVQERVQAAERERAVAVARAIEERRRRRLQLGLAASLLALSTLGGLAFTYELHRRQAAAARVDRLLAEARLLRDQARDQREDVARWDRACEAVGRIGEELGPSAAVALAELRGEVEAGQQAARGRPRPAGPAGGHPLGPGRRPGRLGDRRGLCRRPRRRRDRPRRRRPGRGRRPGGPPSGAGGRGAGRGAGRLGRRPPRPGREGPGLGAGAGRRPRRRPRPRPRRPPRRPARGGQGRAAAAAPAAGRAGRRRVVGAGQPGPAGRGPGRGGRRGRGPGGAAAGLVGPSGGRPGPLYPGPRAASGAAAAGGGGNPRPLGRLGPAAGAGRARPGACAGAARPGCGGRGGLARPGRPPPRERPPPGLLWRPPEGAGPRCRGRGGAGPGDRGVPRGDPPEA